MIVLGIILLMPFIAGLVLLVVSIIRWMIKDRAFRHASYAVFGSALVTTLGVAALVFGVKGHL